MNRIIWPILNTATLLGTLYINYWSNTGALNDNTIGAVSDKYSTLFTPADYAFSIWGFIYLFLLAFVAFQWYVWRTGKYANTLQKPAFGLPLPMWPMACGWWPGSMSEPDLAS